MPLTTPVSIPPQYVVQAEELRDLLATLRFVCEENDAPMESPMREAYSSLITLSGRAHRDAHTLAENLAALIPERP